MHIIYFIFEDRKYDLLFYEDFVTKFKKKNCWNKDVIFKFLSVFDD